LTPESNLFGNVVLESGICLPYNEGLAGGPSPKMSGKRIVTGGAVASSLLITILYLVLQSHTNSLYLVSNISEAAFSLVPLIIAVYLLKSRELPFYKSTICLTIGFFLWFLGEVIYSTYALLLGVAIPYPSMADFFWLTGYWLVLLGMTLSIQPFRFAIKSQTLVLATVVSITTSVLVAAYLVIPVIAISPDTATNMVGFAYPISDIALLFASILGFLLFRGGKVARGWYLLVLGTLLFSVADILFSFTTAKGTYFDGHPLELLYDYGYVCFGLSLYSQLKVAWD